MYNTRFEDLVAEEYHPYYLLYIKNAGDASLGDFLVNGKKDTLIFFVFVFSMQDTRVQSVAAAMCHTRHSHCVFHNRYQPNDPLGYNSPRNEE